MAEETLAILRAGGYDHQGRQVALPDLTPMRRGTRLFTPLDAPRLLEALQAKRGRAETTVQVTGEDTFAAARRIQALGGSVMALNFASALKPGGGFLSGAKSQEEDLARCSALYLSLSEPEVAAYYQANRTSGTALYTHHLIYSPAVPVFRDSSGALLRAPVPVNVITAPAPNAGAVLQHQPACLNDVPAVLRERAALVLGLAALMNERNLILGAWGCGVFMNDPAQVAGIFHDLLSDLAQGAFEHVVFAVLDRQEGQPVLRAFQEAFG